MPSLAQHLNALDARVQTLHQSLRALYDAHAGVQPGMCEVHLVATKTGAAAAQHKTATFPCPKPSGASGHALLRTEAAHHKAVEAIETCHHALAGLLTPLARSAPCRKTKNAATLHLLVDALGAQVALNFGLQLDAFARTSLLLPAPLPHTAVPYASGILHANAHLLTTISGLDEGPRWQVEVSTNGRTHTHTIQARDAATALAWTGIICPMLLEHKAQIRAITQIHDLSPEALQGLHRPLPVPQFVPLPVSPDDRDLLNASPF